MLRRLVCAAVVLGCVVCVMPRGRAQTSPIYSWTISSSGKPYGCNSWVDGPENTWFTLSRNTGGPGSLEFLRVTAIANNDTGDSGWGCRWPGEGSSVAQGSSRYIRFYYRVNSPVNWRSDSCAVPPCSSNNRTTPDKLFILGDTCGSPTRMIAHQYAEGPARDTPQIQFVQGTRNSDVGSWVTITPDVWHAIQLAVHSSSTAVATDGNSYVYVDNTNQGAPDGVWENRLITTDGWSTVGCASSVIGFGDFSYNPLSDDDPTTSAIVDLAGFEYDDEWDPNWTVPETPSRAPRLLRRLLL